MRHDHQLADRLYAQRKKSGVPIEVLEVWKRVLKTTKERDESFDLDYQKLCASRWGPLPHEQKERYRKCNA